MDLKAEIAWIQEELNDVKDPLLIEMFRNLLLFKKKWEKESSAYEDLEEYNKEIDQALEDFEEGRVYGHKEVEGMLREWQKR